MEHQKILDLLDQASDLKFVTRKWKNVNDQSSANYDIGNEIIYNKEVSNSNLCDYNDTYILIIQLHWHSRFEHHSLSVSQKLIKQQK